MCCPQSVVTAIADLERLARRGGQGERRRGMIEK
jgi:hypothetical protein